MSDNERSNASSRSSSQTSKENKASDEKDEEGNLSDDLAKKRLHENILYPKNEVDEIQDDSDYETVKIRKETDPNEAIQEVNIEIKTTVDVTKNVRKSPKSDVDDSLSPVNSIYCKEVFYIHPEVHARFPRKK